MAARITYLVMAIGALMIGAGGLSGAAFVSVFGVSLMVLGAIGAAVVLEPVHAPVPAEQPVSID